ncbi:hypothetical protein [Burkholderia vietnamiensis]|uniref:hypothetical protein n=1 Tax=Burkholderia vietnamiensis TaxID=60552 RepID=UPI001B92671F|nr:hypothetical protein [Burkholderia vietnamiensis]MBR8206320.1 hypothetical protein [Burkholderia vietnamiensis]MCA8230686.1 hypothetical protein [Burkholderia vietnamiensis]MCA8391443.1 hypothetical protein [Burkholderia vietnamiensis]MDN8073841.1 hypothetical protein [Burkholderia vietnamiensis]MEC4596681.1 hypothetical protein [Burkholderia vietnamiensis]
MFFRAARITLSEHPIAPRRILYTLFTAGRSCTVTTVTHHDHIFLPFDDLS